MCENCELIEKLKEGKNPYFLVETKAGYLMLHEHQPYPGMCLFLCKEHVQAIYELEFHKRNEYLTEMGQIAHAIHDATNAVRVDIEMCSSKDGHLDTLLVPRKEEDLKALDYKPAFSLPQVDFLSDKNRFTTGELKSMKEKLLAELEKYFPKAVPQKKGLLQGMLLDKIFDGVRISLIDRRGNVVAYVDMGKRNKTERVLSRTYVSEGYRSKGLGTFLIDEAERICEQEGTTLIKSCSFASR